MCRGGSTGSLGGRQVEADMHMQGFLYHKEVKGAPATRDRVIIINIIIIIKQSYHTNAANYIEISCVNPHPTRMS